MNCEEFANIVHELAREDAREVLGDAGAVMARFHAETCETCAARLAAARSLALALGEAAEDSGRWGVPAAVGESLASAFREHHRSLERARFRTRRLRLRWAEWMALAAAAAALVILGAWNFSRGHGIGQKANAQVIALNPSGSGANAPEQTNEPVEMAAADDSDFVPVPFGESFSADDPGLVVRVSLTRSALGSLGYPVDEMNGGDVVQADLLVGEDGLPRAVRLVQQ